MRKMRKAFVATATLGLVFGMSSQAFGDGASENISQLEGALSPNAQSATKAKAATLFTQVQTFDGAGGPFTIPNKAAEQVFIDFDDDMSLSTKKVKSCGGDGGDDLDTSTTEQAVSVCSKSIVGSGTAQALVPAAPPAPPVVPVELTVTSINGPQSVAGGACTAPADATGGPEGCEFIGGNPTITLHAYNQALSFITTVSGEIQDSPDNSADYGQRLAVTDAPDTAGDAGALILFNSTVGKQTKFTKKKNGRKVTRFAHYIKATCGDDGVASGGKEYDFGGTWVYDDGTTDVDTFKQKCGTP